MEHRLPIRCRAEEVAEQLRRVVAGLPFLAHRSWDEVGWGRMRIELLSLWRVELALEPDPADRQVMALTRVDRADSPDGRCWEYGCQRDDWTLGPDSRLVEPIQFLNDEERHTLTQKLQQASCWPAPLPAAAAPALVLHERDRPRRPPRRTQRRSGL